MFYRIAMILLLSSCSYTVLADTKSVEPLTVVELFTSQGCYSCPPADEYLGELAALPHVITLSCHVTYWNYLGWKDTFSRQFCDNRQRRYQSVLKGGYRGVYTPQMIINGRYAGVGSQQERIQGLFSADQRRQAPVQAIKLSITSQQIEAILPKLDTVKTDIQTYIPAPQKRRHLFLIGTSGKHVLPINSGENSGKHLPYFNPVEYAENLGEWDGDERSLSIPLPKNKAIKDWIIIAQAWPVGEIAAAGKLSHAQ